MPEMGRAGFCRLCGQNVWLTPEGAGSCGHPAEEIENVYEAEVPPPSQSTPAGGRKRSPVKFILAGVAVLLIAILAFALYPRPKFVATAFEVPESIVLGEDAMVRVALANEGRASGEYEIVILIGEDVLKKTVVTLPPDTAENIDIPLAGLRAGTFDLSVAGWEGLAAPIWVMTPARFSIASVSVSPEFIDLNAGSDATALVRVTNTGEASGSHPIELLVDGTARASADVLVDGGSSAEETFSFKVPGAGVCEVSVNGVSVDMPVYKIEHPANGTVLLNQLSGGSNQLKVVNNFDEDHLVVLSAPGENQPALLSVYVRANSSHTVRGIKNGTYSCYYASGSAWCAHRKQFTKNAGYGRFEDDDTYSSTGSRYTIFTYTFGTSEGGTATEWVDEGDFPSM